MIELLTETYRRLLAEATVRTYRYLFDTFDASGRLTGLVGPRGVGKTTLMLQYIRDRMRDPTQAIYASADHIYFNKVNLLDFVREVFTTQGTQHFFFDEVHKHAGWEQELKNIDKVRAVVEKTVYEDVATCYRLKTENLHHFRKILFFLATIPPGDMTVHKLATSLAVDDKTATNYLQILIETGLTRMVLPNARGHAIMRRPQKTFLDNATLSHAICEGLGQAVDTGTVRELFFLASVQNAGHSVSYSEGGAISGSATSFSKSAARTKGAGNFPRPPAVGSSLRITFWLEPETPFLFISLASSTDPRFP